MLPVTPAAPTPVPPGAIGSDVGGEPAGAPPSDHGKRRRGRAVLLIVLLAALAAGGVVAWTLIDAGDQASEDDFLVPRDEPDGDSGDSSIGGLAVEAIDETEDVVDQINDNSEEAELLGELGLDPTGEPIEEPAPAAGPTRYSFVYDRPDQTTFAVQVDLASSSFSTESFDGAGLRFVEGATYSRPTLEAEWSVAEGAPAPQVPMLFAFPTLDSIIDDTVRGYVVAEEARENEFGTVYSYLVDDHAFHASDPASRTTWLATWGLDAGFVPQPPSSSEFTAEAYGGSAPGVTAVQITVDDSGEVIDVTMASQAIGGFHWVRSIVVYDSNPLILAQPIEVPPVGE